MHVRESQPSTMSLFKFVLFYVKSEFILLWCITWCQHVEQLGPLLGWDSPRGHRFATSTFLTLRRQEMLPFNWSTAASSLCTFHVLLFYLLYPCLSAACVFSLSLISRHKASHNQWITASATSFLSFLKSMFLHCSSSEDLGGLTELSTNSGLFLWETLSNLIHNPCKMKKKLLQPRTGTNLCVFLASTQFNADGLMSSFCF